MTVSEWIAYVDQRVWGPGMLVLLMGTGVFLTLRTRFLPWRNLGWALKSVLGRDSRAKAGGAGDVSPFSALMTTLAATIGTGNIVGVATALVAGGPGALVWMEISALFGLSSKCAECLLAVKYRQRDAGGEMRGGPMYTMCAALRWKRLGGALAFLFALFTVLASLGMGDMAQANSIAGALADSFSVPARTTGVAVALLALVVILGGIRRIAGVCSVVVPLMAVLYLLAGTAVLLGHLSALPGAVAEMFRLAFSPAAAAGGAAGTMTASALNAARWGIARGCFSHEAGMGSAAIPAASAATDSPARQGYVNMTGVFFDTTVICTVTGLCICASGVLGTADASGGQVNGVALTALAFKTVLGPLGGLLVSLGIVLFAFSTILGWEFCGETAFAFLFGRRAIPLYRILFALAAFLGATQSLEVVWNLSDIFNALMAVPNLISLLFLSGTAARELEAFQPEIRRALERMGQTDQWAGKLFNIKGRYNDPSFKGAWRSAIIAICDAAERFSETKTGALIVLERNTNLSEIVRTGTPVNSAVNLEVLGTIFYEGTPLHDGAAIIENGRIKAAGCVLPLSNNLDLGKDMGTRHRACLGIAENSDAIAVVVSEETGIISMAKNGVLIRHFDRQTLYTRLVDEMIPKETASEKAAADGWRGKVKSLLNWMNQKEEDEQQ